MGEWIPTHDGIPLKTTDALLEHIYDLGIIIGTLEAELATYRTIVPNGSDKPANVPGRRAHRSADNALPG